MVRRRTGPAVLGQVRHQCRESGNQDSEAAQGEMMAHISAEEAEALSHTHATAALDQAYALLKTDKEALRAGHWNRLDEKDRQMICHMAGIGSKKGKAALRELNALERGKVNREAQRLIRVLETVIRCAQGGDMPAAWGAMQ